ncbi:hypothetical protein [Nocardia aurantiaca]|uniref:Uncharacterized protein n=1 Tax=Nocardia aurantiaca TaxID=2675850 RepID=A0A6I3KU85_9NOCA|nr:hypothetical protein [Nocardia aurantiaca]MTE13057.1 hypothetical protein [Nocardia aurantiaca]
MTIEYIGKADSMLAEYTAMLQRSDARNAEARALLAEAEELAAEARELDHSEFMATPDEQMQIKAHRTFLQQEIDAKSGRVLQLHQETFQEWESWTTRQW